MNSDDDFIFFSTPIEHDDDVASHKKKALTLGSGTLPALPSWNQQVREDEGRRRFHGGCTTGEYSADYFNSAGSTEGWTPQMFKSSRKSRADYKQQSVMDFLDEDEKAEMDGQSLETSMKYDTFGFTAVEIARKKAETDQKQRPSACPEPVPDKLIVSTTDSEFAASELPDTSEAPLTKHFMGPQSTPLTPSNPQKKEESVTPSRDCATSTDHLETNKDLPENFQGLAVENNETPVDLYKAIFSDDSDDEEEILLSGPVKEDPQKMSEIVNTTLSRLTAGDFLESLGKELGLEVPPDMPQTTSKPNIVASSRGSIDVSKSSTISDVVDIRPLSLVTVVLADTPKYENHGKPIGNSSHGYRRGDLKMDAVVLDSNSNSDSSVSGDDRHRNRSKRSKKRSSREKSSSRKKHHNHSSKGRSYPISSHHDRDKDSGKVKRRKEKY